MPLTNRPDHYILKGHEVVSVDLLTWARWLENGKDRIVRQETTDNGYWISTVFLGLDHSFGYGPPLLFESMVFGHPKRELQDRYTTWDEAEAGHDKLVKQVSKWKVKGNREAPESEKPKRTSRHIEI